MSDILNYDDLLDQYHSLEKRITRFATIEQELINTRDKLDHELELFRRLHKYTTRALGDINEKVFFEILTEAVVDILEVEASLVIIQDKHHEEPIRSFKESAIVEGDREMALNDILTFTEGHVAGVSMPLNQLNFANSLTLRHNSFGIANCIKEDLLGYNVYILGLVSQKNEALYNPIEDRHLTLMALLVQQATSILANRKRSEKITKQYETIQASEQELKKLSLIATKTKNSVVITDYEGRIEWINAAFTRVTGYGLEEIKGKKPKEFLQGPETPGKDLTILTKALRDHEDSSVTLINYRKSGAPYYNQLETTAIRDADGRLTNFISIQRDITNEIKVQDEILRINNRFELLSSQSRTGVWEWDVTTQQIYWNDTLYEIYGLDKSSENNDLYQAWQDCLHPDDLAAINANNTLLRSGKLQSIAEEYRIISPINGKIHFIKAMTIAEVDSNGNLLRLLGNSQDITDLKQLQTNLENAVEERDQSINKMNLLKTFYENVLNHSPSQIQVFDSNLQLTFSNIADSISPTIWNIPLHGEMTESMSFRDPEKALIVLHEITEAIRNRKLIQIEDSFVDRNGIRVHFLRSILPYFNNHGNLENIIVTGVDITELKNTQEAMTTSNNELRKINLELDNFVYSISHDLRSPLLSIKGIIALILNNPALDESSKTFLEMADKSANRLDLTIQEILEYSRNSRLDIVSEPFDLVEMIDTIFDDNKFASNHEVEMVIALEGNPIIKSDKSRVNILLKNLIGNSIKYKRENINSWIHVSIYHDENNVRVIIEDNGEGIAEKHLDQIFNMFYRATTSSVGTGLGLYLCKEIATKLNGSIIAESVLGEGTKMTFILTEQTQ